MVISAGPAVNLIVAFVLLLVFFAIGPNTDSTDVGVIEKGLSRGQDGEPGDRIVSVDGKRGDASVLQKQIASHRCARTPPVNRCKASTPARWWSSATADPADRDHAGLRHQGQAHPARLLVRGRPPRPAAVRRGLRPHSQPLLVHHQGDRGPPARLFDSEKRKEITGVVGSYEVTRQTILNNIADVIGIMAIISLSLAIVNLFRSCRSTAVTSSGRWWRRCAQAGAVQRHGTRRRGGFHAGDRFIPLTSPTTSTGSERDSRSDSRVLSAREARRTA